ncbi:centromere-associated protein E isoform X3 [Podarcis lilfordi]|uniref:Centromere-associated protein E n=1 Tax=Podarcis lilfordi TaxID=74358 RepID=A0AA35KUL3_9SAUR|nr:centromere-associated protein E isoform X3 [Podarcis lilfordi]
MAEEGGVTVCVRVRPLIARENADHEEKQNILWKTEECTISQVDGTKSFTFDRVFHSSENTTEVYEGVAASIIKSAVQGYNGTIFAYGQTASGKTYTMLGTKDCPGIIPMAINDVFNSICGNPDREFLLRVSYMEIHNDRVQDLLCSNIKKKKPLVVREDISRHIFVEDLSEEVVVSPEQVVSWLQKGEKNRHYGETNMNDRSSRSHAIFRMIIESKEKTDSSSYDGAVMVSHLNFVDLAGSERASQTGAEGIRLKEGCNINRSLSILGQVIKKLCDDQAGGYINYRDSKLTRILQNSLGGNAKTVIICTVTPASLEETLSTLQFASTAKNMKNSPIVNEVLTEDALLKRYRSEIEDLKRRLEEVSPQSQLAQIIEEKNALQKEQQEKIRALTEMLVTAPSFASAQDFKVRRKRRVTWAPGAINQEGGECLLGSFPSKAKQFKTSLSCLSEMEESVSSEFSEHDDQWMTASVTIPEEEWIPGSEVGLIHKDFADSVMLCETLVDERDNAVTEQQALKVELKNLQMEKEQIACELKELKEKMSVYEFVALERETAKEQEMQLMHEISSLKTIITNAEVCNQDLQEEVMSKALQIEEQKNKIKALENHVSELRNLMREAKTESGESDVSSILNNSGDEMQKMKQSLSDVEAVALDSKRESSFLRSENIALKEKMDQLSDTYKQMEKDIESYRRQLDSGKVAYKKMQSDLQKELQYYLQENSKLASLLEGRVPNDLLSCMELERKIAGLKDELNKALEENSTLRKEAAASLEARSGPDTEIFQKEVLEKSEMIASLASEKEMLLAQVSEKERLLCEATIALKSKEDFVNSEAMRQNDLAFQELKCHCDELEQKFLTASEENKQMKCQLDLLSEENLKLQATIHEVTQELSGKIKEMQEKDLEQEKLLGMREQLDEAHQKLSEMEKLKDQLKSWGSKMEAEEMEKLGLAQRLQESEKEMQALTRERDDLKQKEEALRRERDQIKEDIQETVSMNIESQEELRNAQNSLKHCEKQIKELEEAIVEREAQISSVKESLGVTIEEQKQQILKLTEHLDYFNTEKNLLTGGDGDAEEIKLEENNQLQSMKEKILSLEQEKTLLKQQLESLQEQKNWYLESSQLPPSKIQELQTGDTEEDRPFRMKEELCQALEKLSEMEQLRKQLEASESRIEAEVMDKLTVTQKLHEQEEAMKAIMQERDNLKDIVGCLQIEKDLIKEKIEADVAQKLHNHEGAMEVLIQERDDLRRKLDVLQKQGKLAKEEAETEVLHEHEEAVRALTQERDYLKDKLDALQVERDLIKEEMQAAKSMQDDERALEELLGLKEELCEAKQKQSVMKQLDADLKARESELEAEKMEKLEMAQRLHSSEEEKKSLIQAMDALKQKWEAFQTESESLQRLLEASTSMVQQLEEKNLDLRQLLESREEQSRTAAERLNEMEQLKSKTEATEKEKAELLQKLHSAVQDFRTVNREKEDLKTAVDALQTEKDNMIRTIHRLGESVEKMVANNLKLQEQLELSISHKEGTIGMAEEPEGRNLDENSRASELQEILDQTTNQQKREAECCRKAEAALKASKEQIQELLLELNTLKEKQTHCAAANLALEEENYKLGDKLKATEEQQKSLKLKIQELENAMSEMRRNFQEREKAAQLAMELKVRAAKNDAVRLGAVLKEKENSLRSALAEQETLKAKLNEGAESNKDEIEDLKTQLAKADMARMKQSKYFDQEMANAKALAEHREEQLRKLKEELRRVQQEQDVTVIAPHKDNSQVSLAITCGGGSGIVQSTQLLVLKSEHAKLEKEHAQLKKKLEIMLKNELLWKEEVRKWKERSSRRQRSTSEEQQLKSPRKTAPPSVSEQPSSPCREWSLRRQQPTSEEQQLKSPRKTVPPSMSELPSSPCRERSLQPALSLDTPAPVLLSCPTFFDNSRLGDFKDTKSSGVPSTDRAVESTDKNYKQWFAGSNNDDVSKCKTQ